MTSDKSDVIWFQPSYGSTYDQQIPVSYKTSQSNCAASFRLCTSNALSAPQRRLEDFSEARRGCGTPTWPTFIRHKNGTCTGILIPPPVQKKQTFVLRMEKFGKRMSNFDFDGIYEAESESSESPYFTLTPSNKMSAPTDPDENSHDDVQAPPGSGTSESTPFSPTSNSFVDDHMYLSASSASTSTPSSHRHSTSLFARGTAFDSAITPNMFLSTSNPLSFAIPLGFVLCITLVAVILAVHHYRKRVRERSRDAEKLATLSRFSSRDSMYKDPLEYPASAALPAHVSGPVPLFMPVDPDMPPVQETRRASRKSVPVSASYTNVSVPTREPTKVIRGSRPLTVPRGSAQTEDDRVKRTR